MNLRSNRNIQKKPATVDGQMPATVDGQIPSVDDLIEVLKEWPTGSYQDCKWTNVEAKLRHSRVPRRGDGHTLDFDIVTIVTRQTRQGLGTKFLVNLIEAAGLLGRGVMLEQACSACSKPWAEKLVANGILTPDIVDGNFLSTKPVPKEQMPLLS
jgi:hypothetical protein